MPSNQDTMIIWVLVLNIWHSTLLEINSCLFNAQVPYRQSVNVKNPARTNNTMYWLLVHSELVLH